MNQRKLHVCGLFFLSALVTLLWLGPSARSQSAPAQGTTATGPVQDNDTTRGELARFDEFLDGHREIAEQLRKDPSLVNNSTFVKDHPALQTYLQDHPGIREEIRENPSAFMRQENGYDRNEARRDNDTTRAELARFDEFLDGHREISEQLRKDPSLVNNAAFVKNHPALQTYLQQHPGVSEEIKENPNAFMHAENRYDRTEDRRDNETTRAELARFDQFLDGHHEIAEQLRKDPSLVNNPAFVKDHPALQTYLQDHPGIRSQVKDNPGAFMHEENRFDRADNGGDRDMAHARSDDFRAFLGSHADVARQLSQDPTRVHDRDFMEHHPELHDYLNAHPDVNQQLMKDPQGFMKSTQPSFSDPAGKTPPYQPKKDDWRP